MKKSVILIALTVLLAPIAAVSDPYKISILPRFYPERLTAMMSPLVDYLKEQTGLELALVLTKNFQDYEIRLNSGEIVVGYQNPLVYTRVSGRHEAVAIALKGEGGDKFRGILIARPDSGIKGIDDLRGKRVMIVGETSAGGWLSQKLTLMERGIPFDEIALDTAADNRQENVIISVSVGDVDAGFIRESALHVADKYILPGSVVVVEPTAWLPNWAVSVDRGLPDEAKAALAEAVLGLEPGHPVLEAIGLKGFRPASDSDYDIVRKAVGN